MATYGKVLDLFDEGYLKIQDVVGHVAPFPALIPRAEYHQNILVYKMETEHGVFLGQIQDFTDRLARHSRQELWSWFVQWKVKQKPNRSARPLSPLPKKARTSAFPSHTSLSFATISQSQLPTAQPVPDQRDLSYASIERRVIDPEIVKEEDMLRLLLDIVQAESKVVPNFTELLYQYIDDIEGDGYALKCALRNEIPSLWDFEGHPILLHRSKESFYNNREATKGGKESADAERSVRLQYRERKSGLQPPKMGQLVSPQMNIPKDPDKSRNYYAACFKNRQRAVFLLKDAGLTKRQIQNYVKGQTAHPKDTPEEGDRRGWRFYKEDKIHYRKQMALKERRRREKYIESLISERLNVETQHAARIEALEATDSSAGNTFSVPALVIPPTPSSTLRPDLNSHLIVEDNSGSNVDVLTPNEPLEDPTESVPQWLQGKLKSKLFALSESSSLSESASDQEADSEANRDDDPELGVTTTIGGGGRGESETAAPAETSNFLATSQLNNPPPLITVTSPAGPSLSNDTLVATQQSNPEPHSQLAYSTFVPQTPTEGSIQQTQLLLPMPIQHSTLSPDFQNLSFGASPTTETGHAHPSCHMPTMPLNTYDQINAPNSLGPLSSDDIPVLLYFPQCLSDRSMLGAQENTDAFMLGHMTFFGDSSAIELTSAIFLPASISEGLLRRVREGGYSVLESYPGEHHGAMKPRRENTAHANAYSKLLQSFSLMTSTTAREYDLTKRWRASRGMVTEIDRGAIWEGWGLTIDRGIRINADERKGAISMVNMGTFDWETETRKREADELVDEDC